MMKIQKTDSSDIYLVNFNAQVALFVLQEDEESQYVEDYGPRMEGAQTLYYGKRYERDPTNRQRAIEIHGLTCIVCGFNFERVYGERGRNFIEVHHVKPLCSIKGNTVMINPATDLVPLCANCHRMVHRRHQDILTIEEMKQIINKTEYTNSQP